MMFSPLQGGNTVRDRFVVKDQRQEGENPLFTSNRGFVWPPLHVVDAEFFLCVRMRPKTAIVGTVSLNQADLGAVTDVGIVPAPFAIRLTEKSEATEQQ